MSAALDLHFLLFASPAVILVGLAKGGFSGLGALGTPLMALATDEPVKAAAILLPILLVQDVVGVAAFRRSWDGSILAAMLPGAVAGVGLGYVLAAAVSADAVMAALGAVSILFGAYRLWAERGGRIAASSSSPRWVGSLFGVITGFTSQIAHAGGPPFQMWVMPRKLDRDVFVGTSAIFFAVLNWVKVPAYVALGEFTRDNAIATAVLLPVAVLASLAGVKLVRRVAMERFYTIVYVLMIVAGVKLLLDGTGIG
ncbi:sulfite exporter TauE/SafE family protein [Sphingomonas parva]|uniref:Probable membrane transporter protein n=1 Tax=Sphingomonas parva TaxID=2555898 RepID=A0A4Y8ZMR5_9SPHN|nr:sulfite exporter TauE/SafE family protein [Sphingomonas parva]TFI57313.1 sulfite exporter TauE/SafE family protein [Sphingomonas parva]